ncbi:hypothetical protein [Streptococcus halichoeri]|uniref:hypothetical protein n=1 Tax=Streptococcus halichoeri TaxID=254785 RepID=UPI00135C6DBB|nr:hypothetical protein [Streptococcus halichoeri]
MKQFRKKAITSLAAVTLAGLFSMTQVTSVSANDGTLKVQSTNSTQNTATNNAHKSMEDVKVLKEKLKEKLKEPSKKYAEYDRLEELETEFLRQNKRDGIFWYEGWSLSDQETTYVTYELEESFTPENFKKKFKKPDDEAKNLADEYLQKLFDFYNQKFNENKS